MRNDLDDSNGFKQFGKNLGNLRDLLELSSATTDKYKSVLNHLEQENDVLDTEEQYNFELIFREFREVLESLFENQHDEKMTSLYTFIQGLIDSVEAYMDRKKELEKVARLESEDIVNRLQNANKDSLEIMLNIERSLKDVEASFFSMSTSKFEPVREPSTKRDTSPSPSSNMQGLFNLRKHLNSPRDASQEQDPFSDRATLNLTRDLKKENADLRLTNETLMHQIDVYKSQINDRDSKPI